MPSLTIEKALRISSMPEGKDWISLSPDVLEFLSEKEVKDLLYHILLRHGVEEHMVFYEGLEKILGPGKLLALIAEAKKKYKAQ